MNRVKPEIMKISIATGMNKIGLVYTGRKCQNVQQQGYYMLNFELFCYCQNDIDCTWHLLHLQKFDNFKATTRSCTNYWSPIIPLN